MAGHERVVIDGDLPTSQLEAIIAARDSAQAAHRLVAGVEQQLRNLQQPARATIVELTPTEFKKTDNARSTSRSIGLINPNATAVILGIGGVPPSTNAGGFVVPANRAMILPLAAEDVEIATDAAPGARMVVFLLRFECVQPFFVGALA